MAQLETVEALLESDRCALRVSSGVPDVTARKVVSECSLAPREMRRPARRESANALATAGDLPSTHHSTDSNEKRRERPADELSRQGSVWERSVTAAVAVMGNGDGRVHSTKADTSRCSLEMSDSSRDCRPSRTSMTGPAAPGQRPCTSTNTLGPCAHIVSAAPVPSWDPCPPSATHPIPSTTMDPSRPGRRTKTPTSGLHSSFHTCSTTPPHPQSGSWLSE